MKCLSMLQLSVCQQICCGGRPTDLPSSQNLALYRWLHGLLQQTCSKCILCALSKLGTGQSMSLWHPSAPPRIKRLRLQADQARETKRAKWQMPGPSGPRVLVRPLQLCRGSVRKFRHPATLPEDERSGHFASHRLSAWPSFDLNSSCKIAYKSCCPRTLRCLIPAGHSSDQCTSCKSLKCSLQGSR